MLTNDITINAIINAIINVINAGDTDKATAMIIDHVDEYGDAIHVDIDHDDLWEILLAADEIANRYAQQVIDAGDDRSELISNIVTEAIADNNDGLLDLLTTRACQDLEEACEYWLRVGGYDEIADNAQDCASRYARKYHLDRQALIGAMELNINDSDYESAAESRAAYWTGILEILTLVDEGI